MTSNSIEKVFKTDDGLGVILNRDNGKWHLSLSRKDRLPDWYEIKHWRYELCPDVPYMAIILPPQDEYVNLHQHCIQLWEID